MNLSVIIPVFNGAETIPLLITRLEPVLIRVCETYEVILVNDGSQDTSWDMIVQLARNIPGYAEST